VPDEAVDRGSSRLLPSNTAGIAAWLDAREPIREGGMTRKRSDPGIARWLYVSAFSPMRDGPAGPRQT
jgi:hypothetical protein